MEGNQFLNVLISRVLYFIAHTSFRLLLLLLHGAFAALSPLRLCWHVTTAAKSFPLPTLPFPHSLECILSDL